MKNRERLEVLQAIGLIVALILMCITVGFQSFAYDAILHVVLCFCIILLSAFMLILDRILQDKKSFYVHFFWLVIWSFNVIITLFHM